MQTALSVSPYQLARQDTTDGMDGQMQFSDISQESLVKSNPKGCHLSPAKICLVVLAAAAACAITGVAVYFAHPDKGKGSTMEPTTSKVPVPTTPPGDNDSPLLPSTMVPTHYDLSLRPDIYRDDPDLFMFSGTVTIDILVKQPSNEITLHQRNLNIDDTTVRVTKEDGQVSMLSYNIIFRAIHRCQKRLSGIYKYIGLITGAESYTILHK